MNETQSERFERMIAVRTGLRLRPRQGDLLRSTVLARVAALRLKHCDDYRELLQSGGASSEGEWGRLIEGLTNNESYFFRDKAQMDLLRDRILPELIERNKAIRSLRIWSAGCSTGEEVYSLAMLVDELLPRSSRSTHPWEIVILGTDIDEQALQRARRGFYRSWSFRTVDPASLHRRLQPKEGGWQVSDACRSHVTFSLGNLVADTFPSRAAGIYEMDLILCRNVFIYFQPDAVSAVLHKFAQTLRNGSYLMTGHFETFGRLVKPLQTLTFPQSVIYRRVDATSNLDAQSAISDRAARINLPVEAPGHSAAIQKERLRPVTCENSEELANARAARVAEKSGDQALLQKARSLADVGDYKEAIGCCKRLIDGSPFASEPYELLASIAQEEGRTDDAKLLLKKALYLTASPHVYMELGALYRSEGDRVRARKSLVTALELLQQLLPETVVDAPGLPSARECILHLEEVLAEGD